MEHINIFLDKEIYNLHISCGYCIRIDLTDFERLIEKVEAMPSKLREILIDNSRKVLTEASNYLDKNPSEIGNCQECENLVNECLCLAAFEFVENGILTDLVTDDVFDTLRIKRMH